MHAVVVGAGNLHIPRAPPRSEVSQLLTNAGKSTFAETQIV